MASRRMARILGEKGERAARDYLTRAGYAIRETNWHCVRGELDIIAERQGLLVFVEAKARRGSGSSASDAALESITPQKRERLLAAIYHYLDETGEEESDWRLDIILTLWRADGRAMARLQHLEDVLGW